MRTPFRPRFSSLICLVVLALPLVSGLGCGGNDKPETGTTVAPPPEMEQADKNMEEYMKTQGQGQ